MRFLVNLPSHMSFIAQKYLVWKALHMIAAVSWFAALFYLPRLFVYHALAEEKQETQSVAQLRVMEKKLYKLGHIAFGLLIMAALLLNLANGFIYFKQGAWLHAKTTLVGLLFAYYLYCGKLIKRFAKGENRHSATYYRWFNEVPALLLIAIVCLATLKPF